MTDKTPHIFARFLCNKSGSTVIEYVMIIGLVGIAIIIGTNFLGTQLNDKLTDMGTQLQNVDLRDNSGN